MANRVLPDLDSSFARDRQPAPLPLSQPPAAEEHAQALDDTSKERLHPPMEKRQHKMGSPVSSAPTPIALIYGLC